MARAADRHDEVLAREIALATFQRIREELPGLDTSLDLDPEHVDLAMEIPAQARLAFHIRLDLQNLDELHLHVGAFWLEWFPCTLREKVDAYVSAVTGLVRGDCRIVEHLRGSRVVRAELQSGEADAWRTIGTWATVSWPWPRRTHRIVRNTAY